MPALAGRPPLYRTLYLQVLLAILAGAVLGHYAPGAGAAMRPLGDGFIKLIKMVIAPVIFVTVVMGIAGSEDMKRVGKTGGLALVYFEVVSTAALLVGLLVVNVLQPGAGMNVDLRTLDAGAVAQYTGPGKMSGVKDFLLEVIPTTMVDAFAKGQILQVLLIAVLFGVALQRVGGRVSNVFALVEKLSEVLF
ncbi:MAG: cation:dicarboxylate symporter family transporter, partial [Acidobacteriota bacterium]